MFEEETVENSADALDSLEPLALEGRQMEPVLKISNHDSRAILQSFCDEKTGIPLASSEFKPNTVERVSLTVKYSDDDSRRKLRAAMLEHGIGYTGEAIYDGSSSKNQQPVSVRYVVSFAQVGRLVAAVSKLRT